MRSEIKILFRSIYREQTLVTDYREPYFWNRILISENLNFSDSDFQEELKCQLKVGFSFSKKFLLFASMKTV